MDRKKIGKGEKGEKGKGKADFFGKEGSTLVALTLIPASAPSLKALFILAHNSVWCIFFAPLEPNFHSALSEDVARLYKIPSP